MDGIIVQKHNLGEKFTMENQTKETKLCKHCQTEISKKAKVCPNCKKKQGGKIKWVIIVIVVLAIIGSIAGGNDEEGNVKNMVESSQSTANKKNEENSTSTYSDEKDVVEYVEITSTDLINSFNENQVKCKQEYDSKMLKVTGTVTSIGTDVLNQVYVCLGSDEEFTIIGIQCYAKDKDVENKIAELKEGDVITVTGKGECGSLSFSLKKAEIVE